MDLGGAGGGVEECGLLREGEGGGDTEEDVVFYSAGE